MRHLTIESLIGLAEGTLSPRDKQDVEDHMLNCAQCFAEASEFLVVELQYVLRHAGQKNSSRSAQWQPVGFDFRGHQCNL